LHVSPDRQSKIRRERVETTDEYLKYLYAGVRNHQAKKLLQGMQVGDRAFFWASNTKTPGIVGIVEASADNSHYCRMAVWGF
jgi:predicted RNA-binding protein with PUA-like domain